MPYSVWTFKLTMKLDTWYKTLDDCKGDKVKAAYKLGLDPYAFNVLGESSFCCNIESLLSLAACHMLKFTASYFFKSRTLSF